MAGVHKTGQVKGDLPMKKKVLVAALVVVLLLAAFFLHMESRYTMEVIEPAALTQEEILEEMPQITISEEELALREYMLSQPQIQAMMARAQAKDASERQAEVLPRDEAAALLEGWIDSSWTLWEVSTSGNQIYVDFWENEEKRVIYTFFADENYLLEKTVGIYQGYGEERDCVAAYVNQNGEVTKYIAKHQWFYWIEHLKEREAAQSVSGSIFLPLSGT